MENRLFSKRRPIFRRVYMIDPLLQAPLFGSILLGIGGALLGAILLLQKRVLISETLSHAIYPGALTGLLVFALLGMEESTEWAAFAGAMFSGWLGLLALQTVERKLKIKSDAALCLVLSLFFGAGVLLVSGIQALFPIAASHAQILLFGQAATLTNASLPIYGAALFCLLFFLSWQCKSLQIFLFDPNFASSIGVNTKALERAIFLFLLVFVVLSIRSVGVVMVAGIVIAPAIAARQWTDRLSYYFSLSGLFGAASGAIGSFLSVVWELPTGPSIVLSASAFTFASLLAAPKRGLIFRRVRQILFRFHCLEENLLKGLWKRGSASKQQLRRFYGLMCGPMLLLLRSQGWIFSSRGEYRLTEEGRRRASAIVRLHRLWELYLTEEFGWGAEKVHASAEEMEHILTPELEERLTRLLSNPTQDPHDQPIPGRLK